MRVLSLPVLLLMASSAPAMAQVGHPPDRTPYRDLVPGHTFTPMAGYVGGSGGPLKLGPHAGMVYGARYDFRSNRNLGFALSVATGKLDRLIVNPFVKLANRTSGPVQQRTTFVDLTAQFNVSGGKSWHGLAPYIGLSGGTAHGRPVGCTARSSRSVSCGRSSASTSSPTRWTRASSRRGSRSRSARS